MILLEKVVCVEMYNPRSNTHYIPLLFFLSLSEIE